MAKGYWIGAVDVIDPVEYIPYTQANGPSIAAHGGRFIVRGGDFDHAEGVKRHRNIVVEFPSYEAALTAFHSEAYQSVAKLRHPYSIADIAVVEGYEGPQPTDAPPVQVPGVALGYWIVRLDITDPERFDRYREARQEALKAFGGWVLVFGGRSSIVEGTGRDIYSVVVFPNLQAARACYSSYVYKAAHVLREQATAADMIIIAGYDGPTVAGTGQ